MTDWAYVPSLKRSDEAMVRLMMARPNTMVVTGKKIKNVSNFLGFLENASSVPKPVEDLHISSHSNERGNLVARLFKGAPPVATYETFQVAKKKGWIKVPSVLVKSPTATDVHIHGCLIGESLETAKALKQAFGPNIKNLSAPLHYQVAARVGPFGYMEFLLYSWRVYSKTRITKRNVLLSAFNARNFTDIAGASIPAKFWASTIPRNFDAASTAIAGAAFLNPKIGKIGKISTTRYTRFQHLTTPAVMSIPKVNKKPSNNLQTLQNWLPTHELMKSSHPYPLYKRLGYASVTDFVAGFTWSFTYVTKTKKLICRGVRHTYEMLWPVIDPVPKKAYLFFDFYPAKGTNLQVIQKLPESDSRLFRTV